MRRIERISTGNNRKELVQTRITTARRTVFALMGAGLQGLNGVNPKVVIHLIQIYRWVALFVADMSLLFRYHLCSFVPQLYSTADIIH
jgi:hypothetical protein